ncbi:hypothetical protein MICABA_00422 [Microbacterium sp. T2.11-28]|nr:hypothetical protein MICABA_00422 [Microbacterium sp. T2.11-28]
MTAVVRPEGGVYGAGMEPIRVGLVADPASPTDVARRMTDLTPSAEATAEVWEVEFVSEPFTLGSEDVDIALARLRARALAHQWDLVIGVTELPLRDDDGRYLVAALDTRRKAAVLSLPALGGLRVRSRARRTVRGLVTDMAGSSPPHEERVTLPGLSGRGRVLLGMVLANRPWLLAAGLKSALVAALATGAVATIEPTVWLLAASLSGWRLGAASIASIAIVIAWIIIDGELWDRPEDGSAAARERSRLYNTSTLLTLTVGSSASIVVTSTASMQLTRTLSPFARRLTGRHARLLDAETRRICAASGTPMIALDAANDLTARTYARWGRRIGTQVVACLRDRERERAARRRKPEM